jgi:hypothetical protein
MNGPLTTNSISTRARFQIWEVVFEPDPQNPEKTTSRVATCGGNSICIIDVTSGTVLMKYKHKESK